MINNYIHIPTKSKDESIKIVENIFGKLVWRTGSDGTMYAYPYDSISPVMITQNGKTSVYHHEENVKKRAHHE